MKKRIIITTICGFLTGVFCITLKIVCGVKLKFSALFDEFMALL